MLSSPSSTNPQMTPQLPRCCRSMIVLVGVALLAMSSLPCLVQAQDATTAVPVPAVPAAATTAPTVGPTTTPWEGCIDLDRPNAKVVIGEKTTICLVLGDGLDWSVDSRTYMRLNFQPIADEYSRFHVPQSYNQLVEEKNTAFSRTFDGKNVTVHVSSQQAISFQKMFYNANDKVYPHLTAVIDVQDGVVQGIVWDDACVFCVRNNCDPNTYDFFGTQGTEESFGQPVGGCFLPTTDCAAFAQGGDTDCDLELFVVWTGTDANGKAFQSSSFRYSAFPVQNLRDKFSIRTPKIPDLNPFNDQERK